MISPTLSSGSASVAANNGMPDADRSDGDNLTFGTAATSGSSDGDGGGGGTATNAAEHVYVVPQRQVKSPDDMKAWEKSAAYHAIVGFINTVSQAVQGKPNSSDSSATDTSSAEPVSEQVRQLLAVLERLDQLVDETPPIDQPQRFGNKAFAACYAKIKQSAVVLLQAALPERLQRAAVEMSFYLVESFGNAIRIDYGTGHELAFVMFLCCLFKVGALAESDLAAAGLQLFPRYLQLVRKMQTTYHMEPAGSHGVWSLDDYQFVPFIWGSAQFAVRAPIRPAQFLEDGAITELRDTYMFVGCIDYINRVKRGNFAEHSPQLWNISAVESWEKINSGLVKMYQKELLAKFPVIQHVLFGSLMEFRPVPMGTLLPGPRLGMMPPRPRQAQPATTTATTTTAGSSVSASAGSETATME